MAEKQNFDSVFAELRRILKRQGGTLSVSDDAPTRYCLEAPVGPATLKAWGGKARRPTIPVAWTEIGNAYVSFHLMGLGATPDTMSTALKSRLQGKTCFNFVKQDKVLFSELEELTARSIASFRKAGFWM
jgi:hypothetical protein